MTNSDWGDVYGTLAWLVPMCIGAFAAYYTWVAVRRRR